VLDYFIKCRQKKHELWEREREKKRLLDRPASVTQKKETLCWKLVLWSCKTNLYERRVFVSSPEKRSSKGEGLLQVNKPIFWRSQPPWLVCCWKSGIGCGGQLSTLKAITTVFLQVQKT
jgi:hypothetical protein